MIGLIFGETNFPNEILRKIKKRKLKYLIIDLTKRKKFKKDKHFYSVSIGQFGKLIKILKEHRCKKVLSRKSRTTIIHRRVPNKHQDVSEQA